MSLYLTLCIAVSLNVLFWLGIFFVERHDAKHGRIPERKKLNEQGVGFLYLTDWSTASWGDYVGFSLIDTGAAIGLTIFWDSAMTAMALVAGLFVTVAFYFYSVSSTHRPDSGFPAPGKVSKSGKVHLAYYFAQATIMLWSLHAIILLPLQPEAMYPILLGGAIYLVAFLNDCRTHRYSGM